MNTVHLLDQHSPDIAGKIWQLARMAYQEEANLIGEDKFPPLNRSIKDIQRSCSHYFGICDGEELLAAIEVEGIEDDLLISSLIVIPSRELSGGYKVITMSLGRATPC